MAGGKYLICCVSRSKADRKLVWWRPDDAGYTSDITGAGRYDAARIAAHPAHYNDGIEAIAMPESVAFEFSVTLRGWHDEVIARLKSAVSA